jgi:hypothetical protein
MFRDEPSQDVESWLEGVGDEDFFAQLWSDSDGQDLVVDAHCKATGETFASETRVATASVSPETAHALVRALQSVKGWGQLQGPDRRGRLRSESPNLTNARLAEITVRKIDESIGLLQQLRGHVLSDRDDASTEEDVVPEDPTVD